MRHIQSQIARILILIDFISCEVLLFAQFKNNTLFELVIEA